MRNMMRIADSIRGGLALAAVFGAACCAASAFAASAPGATSATNPAPAAASTPAAATNPPPAAASTPAVSPSVSDPSASSLIARGKYVATEADCSSCHTAPGGKPFAGGDVLKTPFGEFYGPNITPDKQHGIGTWTREDFTRALRLGVRKDGADLYPAMPYTSYTKMSDADIAALWAYMRSIPPDSNSPPAPEKTLHFPFTIRTGIVAWQAVFFKPGRWQPTPGKSEAWNRGAYLVEGPGHCSVCHSPRNVAFAEEGQNALTGGQIEAWYAPDIANDKLSNVSKYDVNQLAGFLKTGHMPGNAVVFGPMEEVVHDSLGKLSDGDVHAIALYLKDQTPPQSQGAPSRVSLSPQDLAVGKELYENNCGACHQNDGKGLKGQVPALAGNTAVTAPGANNVVMAMLEGFAPQGTYGAMGSFAHQFNDAQLAQVANYVRTAWGNNAEPNATPWAVGSWRKYADVPANSRAPALICPDLEPAVLKPALQEGSEALREAANDRGKLEQVVQKYMAERPKSSVAETIEALSSAYCRDIVSEKASAAISGMKVADFSQQVALVLAENRPAAKAAGGTPSPSQ